MKASVLHINFAPPFHFTRRLGVQFFSQYERVRSEFAETSYSQHGPTLKLQKMVTPRRVGNRNSFRSRMEQRMKAARFNLVGASGVLEIEDLAGP